MKVLAGGQTVNIGTTEITPTIGIIDRSRRVTDDFGVTTVVKRGFSRTLSCRFAMPTEDVDGVQRLLAGLRASTALWIADEDLAWLNVDGFYRDFDIEVAGSFRSYCRLTVEGLIVPDTDEGCVVVLHAARRHRSRMPSCG